MSTVPLAAVILGANCAVVDDVKFPDCNLDPQTKTAIRKVGKNIVGTKVETRVDEITFSVSQTNSREIELFQKPNRITVIEPNRSYSFQGQKDGRSYTITIDQDFKPTGGFGSKKNVAIIGTCDNTPQAKP